jgi:hypothetical protein
MLMTGAEREAIIARWIELVREKVPGQWMRENLVGIALVLAELAGRFLLWEHALEILEMGESQVCNRWRAQGQLTLSRAWLVRLLQTKYPAEFSPDVKQMVEQQTDLALLDQWHEAALVAPTFEQFVQKLK